MHHYKIVNPFIIGTMSNMVSSTNSLNAAKDAWERMSQNHTGYVNNFNFTLQKIDDSTLHHFNVAEQHGGKNVSYEISEVTVNATKKVLNEFTSEIKKLNDTRLEFGSQTGGASKRYKKYNKRGNDDDSSSSSDSDSEVDSYIKNKLRMIHNLNNPTPVMYWWYTPTIYNVTDLWVPTLAAPIVPVVQIRYIV